MNIPLFSSLESDWQKNRRNYERVICSMSNYRSVVTACIPIVSKRNHLMGTVVSIISRLRQKSIQESTVPSHPSPYHSLPYPFSFLSYSTQSNRYTYPSNLYRTPAPIDSNRLLQSNWEREFRCSPCGASLRERLRYAATVRYMQVSIDCLLLPYPTVLRCMVVGGAWSSHSL